MSMSICEKQKSFPAFNRLLYERPEELFKDWVYDDFLALTKNNNLNNRYNAGGIIFNWMRLSGWVFEDIPIPSLKGKVMSWEFYSSVEDTHQKGEPFMLLTPLGVNLQLFPYSMKVFQDSERIDFSSNTAAFRDCPKNLIVNAANNVSVPLGEALLFSSFCDTYNDSEPLLGESEGSDILEQGVPFEVLLELFISLVGKDKFANMGPSRLKCIRLAKKLMLLV